MKPNKLIKNDIVGVCAPSGVIKNKHQEYLKKSEELLKEYGLSVLYSKNLFSNLLGYSASVIEKSEDINNFINDTNVKAIIFAKGGSNANSILDKIDYEKIKENPKIFIGFSDNTVLLNAIYKKTGLVTYHFTNYKGFCESNLEFNKKQFENVILNGIKGKVQKYSTWETIRPGSCTGILVGGNLSSLSKILNTEYCVSFNNTILFLEELSLEVNEEMISGLLYQLKQNRVFDEISGLLLGNYESKNGISLEKIVMDVLGDYNFPIIKCEDFGHTNTNIVLPIGIKCTLDADKCELVFEENTTN